MTESLRHISVIVRHVAGPYDGVLGIQQCSRCGWIVANFIELLTLLREPLFLDMTKRQPTVAEFRQQIRPYAVGRSVTVLCGTMAGPFTPVIDCTPVRAPSRRYFLGETTAYA